MSQTIITKEFEDYKAQQEARLQPVALDEFVLANVPGLDPTQPISREETVPTEHIVHVSDVHQSGYVNPNAVVYSITLDTTIGDFEFNWIGLRNKQTGTLCAVTHMLPISKYQSIVGVQNGNAITRSILMSYVGAQQATGITVDASTWQVDFTARLQGIDEAERLANRDHYGAATFFGDGFLVYKTGLDYKVTLGLGYVEGLRSVLDTTQTLSVSTGQHYVYVDSTWQGHVTSRWQSKVALVVSATELSHYTDDGGFIHYVTKVATIQASGNVIDHRALKGEFERQDNAATNADIDAKSNALKHVKLPQLWRAFTGLLSNKFNGSRTDVAVTEKALSDGLATKETKGHDHDNDYYLKAQTDSLLTNKVDKSSITDSTGSTSSVLVASAKAVKTVKDFANAKWTYVTATLTRSGAVMLSNLYNGSSQTKATTEKALSDGLATKANTHSHPYASETHNHDSKYLGKAAKAADSDKVDGLHASSFVRSDTDDNVAGHTEWQDGKEIRLGSSADYRMYHNGTNTHQDNYTGHVLFRQKDHGKDVYHQAENSSGIMRNVFGIINGANTFFRAHFDGATKFETTSSGTQTTGVHNATSQLKEVGQRVFSPNNRNISNSYIGASTTKYASEKAVGDGYKNGSAKHHYTTSNLTLTRNNARFNSVQRWGYQNATISIDGSSFWLGDEIEIVNVREDSGTVTLKNLDGVIYLPDGTSAASHTLTGRGRVVMRKYSGSHNFMITSISG